MRKQLNIYKEEKQDLSLKLTQPTTQDSYVKITIYNANLSIFEKLAYNTEMGKNNKFQIRCTVTCDNIREGESYSKSTNAIKDLIHPSFEETI